MPINNITQTISTLPPAGRRGVDVQTVFVIKQEDFQDHLQGTTVTELNTLKDQLNSRIGEINSTTTTMNGYADTASAGASTATTKASEASTSASNALTSRNQASTFATNSSNSATKASQWADNNYNVEVETGKYSAKHWSTVAQNATTGKVDKVASTDNAIVRFDGVTGAVQNSEVIIGDSGQIVSNLKVTGGVGYSVDTSTFITNTLASGAVIERGSNANGTYVKFADGTMICRNNIVIGITYINILLGGVYRSNQLDFILPANFLDLNTHISFSWSGAQGADVHIFFGRQNILSTNSCQTYLLSVSSKSTGINSSLSYVAIGSWK